MRRLRPSSVLPAFLVFGRLGGCVGGSGRRGGAFDRWRCRQSLRPLGFPVRRFGATEKPLKETDATNPSIESSVRSSRIGEELTLNSRGEVRLASQPMNSSVYRQRPIVLYAGAGDA